VAVKAFTAVPIARAMAASCLLRVILSSGACERCVVVVFMTKEHCGEWEVEGGGESDSLYSADTGGSVSCLFVQVRDHFFPCSFESV
jgi:hypothetical protein